MESGIQMIRNPLKHCNSYPNSNFPFPMIGIVVVDRKNRNVSYQPELVDRKSARYSITVFENCMIDSNSDLVDGREGHEGQASMNH